ncbi:hypothetical protein [Nitrosomonas sp. ANs5]|uniref:hypothetical protein n=1 Tax=Nitrosomonas sp. ANs5 TaxID=3423941 RepID=UPI003D32553E
MWRVLSRQHSSSNYPPKVVVSALVNDQDEPVTLTPLDNLAVMIRLDNNNSRDIADW